MQEKLIGRQKELTELRKWVDSERSEFIAIYGRRRVGKTFLVREALQNEISFHFSGSHGMSRKEQLINFALALREQSGNQNFPIPENWVTAFHELKMYLENSGTKKKIIFLDELPWMDTPKSGFVNALENFWNNWCAWREDVKLIVCGSATSWIINKIINNKGGLHNRITHSMLIKPFHLKECKEYFDAYGFGFSEMQIAECYMALGGIPYYFSLMERGESVAQNIDRLFFHENAPLKNEFDNLYRALYTNYNDYIEVIKVLADKGIGLPRREILLKTGLEDNGEFSKILQNLELCGFIRSYLPFTGKKPKENSKRLSSGTLFQLTDFFSLFYLRFHIEQKGRNEHFWSNMTNSPRLNTWRGISFEMLCQAHIPMIKKALGIADVSTRVYSWRRLDEERGAQVDLLIDRNDETINMCEMKFTRGYYTIDKRDAENLQEKIDMLSEETSYRKNILLTFITTNGIKPNSYSNLVQREVTLKELF